MTATTTCPKCGRVWRGDIHGLIDLLNHPTLHEWLERGMTGHADFSVRTMPGGEVAKSAWLWAWIHRELVLMAAHGDELAIAELASRRRASDQVDAAVFALEALAEHGPHLVPRTPEAP